VRGWRGFEAAGGRAVSREPTQKWRDSLVRVIVTGGGGKLGRSVVAHLTDVGHRVVVFERAPVRDTNIYGVDLTDYGQVVDAVLGLDGVHSGVDAVVHLAAYPAPGIVPDAETFRHNMLSTYNVLQAARRAGIKRVVTASSETVLGLPFDIDPPYLPVDEEYPARPESMYSLVKHLEEQMAIQLVRWDPELSITALRFSNVMEPEDYAMFPSFQDDLAARRWNLWGYIDARDGAQAVRLSLEHRGPGFEAFIIAAADTVMNVPSAALAQSMFPDVPLARPLDGRETLLSIDKAKRLLGYAPSHTWQQELPG
jgi:nucleoside-diphosphate-sugar epimerase